MSLINRMLTDLESRRGGNLRNVDGVIDGLQPSESPVRAPVATRRSPLLLGIVVGAASVAALLAWQPWKEAPAVSAAPAVAPAPAPAAPAPAATAPAPAPEATTASAPALPDGGVPVLISDAPLAAPSPTVEATPAAAVEAETPAAPADSAGSETADPPATAEPVVEPEPVAKADTPAPEPTAGAGAAPADATPVPPAPPAEAPAPRLQPDAESRFVIANASAPAETAELALALIDSGRPEEAEALLREGLAAEPGDTDAARVLGHLLLGQGDARGALEVLAAAAPPLAGDPDYHALIAAAEQRSAAHAGAARRYAELLALQPGNGQWRVGLGISLLAIGDRAGAGEAFRQALADPSLPPALRSFAMQQSGTGAEGSP